MEVLVSTRLGSSVVFTNYSKLNLLQSYIVDIIRILQAFGNKWAYFLEISNPCGVSLTI